MTSRSPTDPLAALAALDRAMNNAMDGLRRALVEVTAPLDDPNRPDAIAQLAEELNEVQVVANDVSALVVGVVRAQVDAEHEQLKFRDGAP